jgi:hypothetical protein
MTKQLACLAVVMALGAACTQQSPQQEPPGGTDSAAAPGAGSSSGTPSSPAAQPTSSGTAAPAAAAVGKPSAPPKPTLKEMTIPSGTSINVTLDSAVASDTSKAEDTVRGKLSKPIVIDGTTVAPAGSEVIGTVISAAPSGKVKGRASIAFRFDRLMVRTERVDIRTARIAREAAPTKGEDAKKVGIGAGAGALIGAIAGGGKGAAIGGAVGAGAGTGVVMATKGDEVRLGPGAAVSTTIQEAVKVLVPVD